MYLCKFYFSQKPLQHQDCLNLSQVWYNTANAHRPTKTRFSRNPGLHVLFFCLCSLFCSLVLFFSCSSRGKRPLVIFPPLFLSFSFLFFFFFSTLVLFSSCFLARARVISLAHARIPTLRTGTSKYVAREASWRRFFDPYAPLLFNLYHYLEQNLHFGLVPENSF